MATLIKGRSEEDTRSILNLDADFNEIPPRKPIEFTDTKSAERVSQMFQRRLDKPTVSQARLLQIKLGSFFGTQSADARGWIVSPGQEQAWPFVMHAIGEGYGDLILHLERMGWDLMGVPQGSIRKYFPEGTEVEIFGLAGATQYNGQIGIVTGRSPSNPERWAVCIDKLGKTISVKPTNIRRTDASSKRSSREG